MFFMKRNPLHDRQKPYAYRYAADIDIQQRNFELQEYDHISIEDIRGHLHDFSVQKNGFAILTLTDEIPYEDYFDQCKVDAYFRQLEAILQQHLQALLVQVFRHAVRLFNTMDGSTPLMKESAQKERSKIPNIHWRTLRVRSTNFCSSYWSVNLTRNACMTMLTSVIYIQQQKKHYGKSGDSMAMTQRPCCRNGFNGSSASCVVWVSSSLL